MAVSCALFFVAMAACIMLEPEAVRHNNGVSYFDHVSYALIPYAAGVLTIAATAGQVAFKLPADDPPGSILRVALFAIAALLVLIVLTPDYVNDWFNWAHVTVSIALFGGQFAVIAWLTLWVWRDPINVVSLVLLTVIGLVAGASQLSVLQCLFISEIAFQVLFLLILNRVAMRFDFEPPGDPAKTRRPWARGGV